MSEKYSSDYRHFDILIWQLPVWSTAIFLLAVTGVAYISNADFSEIAPGINKGIYSGLVLFVCFIFQLAIFNALVRFRDHQQDLANSEVRAFASWWRSGQTWLQIAVIGQTCVLLYLALTISQIHNTYWPSLVLFVAMFWYSVQTIHTKPRNEKR